MRGDERNIVKKEETFVSASTLLLNKNFPTAEVKTSVLLREYIHPGASTGERGGGGLAGM